MASHQLAIAKASFTASLLRPDPISVSRDEISHFHDLVNSVARQCSPTNIQNCKRWIWRNIIPSAIRFNAFGKYLTALSISFSGPASPAASITSLREPSGKRKRLHLLYLINDLLYNAEIHAHDATVTSKVQPFLPGLFGTAASFKNSTKHHRKIAQLLDIWEDRNYYSEEHIEKLREIVKTARDAERSIERSQSPDPNGLTSVKSKPHRNQPFMLPAVHGDQGTPWYDLPAGNLMPHIVPNSTRPINPSLVKPLRFNAGLADEDLVRAVKKLLMEGDKISEIKHFQDQQESVIWDIDELGQLILQDDVTAEALNGDGYYGWSKSFCEKMRRRGNGLGHGLSDGKNAGRSQSRGRSQSQSPAFKSHRYKRRRYSNSDEERSTSRSKSRSRHGPRTYANSRSPSRDRSLLSQREGQSRTPYDNKSRSTSQERIDRNVTNALYPPQPHFNTLPETGLEPFARDVHSIAALQQAFLPLSGHHFNPGALSIPPPPPLQYSQWSPQQPPPPPSTMPYGQQAIPAGSWPTQTPPFPQYWSPASYGQMPSGLLSQSAGLLPQGGNGRGAHSGRGWEGAGHYEQHHQGVGSRYGSYRGNDRGSG